MLIRRLRLAIALVALALVIGACQTQPIVIVASITPSPTATPTPVPSPTPVTYRDTIVIGVQQESRTLHPFLDDSSAAIHIQDALYERYVTSIDFAYQANPNGGLLADAPTLENGGASLDDGGTPNDPVDDQLTLAFRLLPGPTWCDGRPVTARDSVYAFNLARDPDSGVASRVALDKIESYTALDDFTVEVKFKRGQLDPSYSSYFWTPLPEHLWGKLGALELQAAAEAARRPCGYGPYTIAGAEGQGAGWIAGDSLTLIANPHYFRGAPKTPRLIFKFTPDIDQLLSDMLAGNLDVAIVDRPEPARMAQYARLADGDAIRLVAANSPAWEQLVFNLDAPTTFDANDRTRPHPILSDVRVRRAIAHAIDRRALIAEALAGRSIVLDQPLVYPDHPLYAPGEITVYDFNLDQARALLDEAGWRDTDGDGVRECRGCVSGAAEGDRLALTYRTTRSTLRERSAQRIQQDLAAVGFDLTIHFPPQEVFFGDVTGLIVGDFEIGQMAGLTDADPGGERQYGCDWIPTPDNGWYGENYSGWCNPAASDALVQARQALRLDDRRAAYAVFQREYTRDVPGLPLFPRLDVFLVNPRLENFRPEDFMRSATWNAFQLAVLNE
jgi:peptide/nickel transport system substrate-binding protein